MATGYGANYADAVEEDFVRTICPEELAAFLALLEEGDIYMGECRDYLQDLGDTDDVDAEYKEKAEAVYKRLLTAFRAATGLELSYEYHDSESNGDKYDDIKGAFFRVEGVYELTPAGRKFHQHISRQFFVTVG